MDRVHLQVFNRLSYAAVVLLEGLECQLLGLGGRSRRPQAASALTSDTLATPVPLFRLFTNLTR